VVVTSAAASGLPHRKAALSAQCASSGRTARAADRAAALDEGANTCAPQSVVITTPNFTFRESASTPTSRRAVPDSRGVRGDIRVGALEPSRPSSASGRCSIVREVVRGQRARAGREGRMVMRSARTGGFSPSRPSPRWRCAALRRAAEAVRRPGRTGGAGAGRGPAPIHISADAAEYFNQEDGSSSPRRRRGPGRIDADVGPHGGDFLATAGGKPPDRVGERPPGGGSRRSSRSRT